jgi:hypothetical protein
VIGLLLNFLRLVVLPGTTTGDLMELGEPTWFDLLELITGLLQITVFIATAIFFLMWLYRVNRNLRPLGASVVEYTPGWAVGWFFVPFANLVMPYRVVNETWVRSDPRLSEPGEESWQQSGSSSLLGWWWGIWMVSSFIDRAVFRLSMNAETPDQFFTLAKVELLSDAFTIVSALLAISVVRGIDKRQEVRSKSYPENYLPPPPPAFTAPRI